MLTSPTSTTLRGLVNVASLESAVLFFQTHCLYGIPTGLQGGLKPCHTISQIISVVYLTPNTGKWNITVLWAMKLGKSRPVPQAWLGGSDLSWVPAPRYQILCHGVVHSPVNCRIASHCIFLQLKRGWYQLRDPWGKRAPKLHKYRWL